MARLGLETEIVDQDVYEGAVRRYRDNRVLLPTFAQLADPATIPEGVTAALEDLDPDAPDSLNLFRIHWYNGPDRRGTVLVPAHLVLPEALTGVRAPIVESRSPWTSATPRKALDTVTSSCCTS